MNPTGFITVHPKDVNMWGVVLRIRSTNIEAYIPGLPVIYLSGGRHVSVVESGDELDAMIEQALIDSVLIASKLAQRLAIDAAREMDKLE